MAQNIDSKVRAKVWLTLDQVDALRSACYSTGADYLQQRNEAIIALMYDTGLRVGELVAIDVDMLRGQHGSLPTDRDPEGLPQRQRARTGDVGARLRCDTAAVVVSQQPLERLTRTVPFAVERPDHHSGRPERGLEGRRRQASSHTFSTALAASRAT